jgi:hypothetical protein
MCVIAAKYFKNVGWVGVKNRDRKYKPKVTIKQSKRGGIEKMFIYDNKTHYTEGLNEFGICILHTALIGPTELVELDYGLPPDKRNGHNDALTIRKALTTKNIKDALKVIEESEVEGNTVVFNHKQLFVHEGYFKNREALKDFTFETREYDHDDLLIRTNHLEWLPGNPTTAQIMLVPAMLTLHYKPTWSDIEVDFNKLNSEESKTFCEIISNKKLITFKEWNQNEEYENLNYLWK